MSMKAVCRLIFHKNTLYKPSFPLSALHTSIVVFSETNLNRKIMTEEKTETLGLPLKEVVSELTKFADLSLAENWDNVGLLIEPFTETPVKNILLTNDLTEVVMKESIDKKINLIISYHPPIFSPLKRITKNAWKERLVSACLENRIAVFSPHTSWDAVSGGVNDWLADSFDVHIQPGGRRPLVSVDKTHCLAAVTGPTESLDKVLKDFNVSNISERSNSNGLESCIVKCKVDVVGDIKKTLPDVSIGTFGTVSSGQIEKNICGMGRMLQVSGLTISKCVELVKSQVGLPHVRLALAKGKSKESEVKTIALCAGSGGSLLKGVKADLFVTGELFHHDLLEANHNGTSVILTNHSDSERGFLKKIGKTLQETFRNSVNITVSSLDSDPLKTV